MSLFTEQKIIWLEALLIERFGIPLKLDFNGNQLILSFQNESGTIIFNNLNSDFHQFGTSALNCRCWNPESEGFLNILKCDLYAPGLNVQKIFNFNNDVVYCGYDILGLAFWSLNRLEEVNNSVVDEHGRFPFSGSHASKYGYIEYPIVDQWLDILKQSINKINKKIFFENKIYKPYVTHDIDRPARYYFSDSKNFLKSVVIDFLRERKIINLITSFSKFFSKKIPDSDPYNTFDWLMDVSDKYGLKSSFYFICGGNSKYDANYNISSLEMRSVINNILGRNHIVGLHPSYFCFLDSTQIFKEVTELKKVLPCDFKYIGGRMHYLRFKYPETLNNLVKANIKYDSTLGYAEQIGFRCGTCHSYYPFDPLRNETINIRVFPLIVMDGTLTTYMNMRLDDESTFHKVKTLIHRCRETKGNFVLLWHNSELKNDLQKNFYEKVVSAL